MYLKAFKGFLRLCVVSLWAGTAFAQVPAPAAPPASPAPAATPAPATTANNLPLGIASFSSWKFEQVGDHLHLVDRAVIEGPMLKFFADDVDLYINTNRIVASGNVVFVNGDGRISAERVEFNTGTGVGTFFDASGIMSLAAKPNAKPGAPPTASIIGGTVTNPAAFGDQDPDVYFYGEKIEKLGPRKYRITKGGFSTCVQPTPRWEVTSDHVVLNLDDYAIANNTVLRVKGVPVFYLPILYYPIRNDQRTTGFLMPSYGASTLRGQSLSNAFFWAIDRSEDATFFHDWFTKTGTGEGAEYRYIAGAQSAGNIRFYRFAQHEATYTTAGTTTTLPPNTSYLLTGALTQTFGKAHVRMRLNYFTDILTQQLYHQNVYQATQTSRLIEGGASDTFGPLSTTVLYQRNETFNSNTSSVLYGSTPKVDAILAPQQLFGAPVYASMNSEFAYLPYESLTSGVATQNNSLARIDIAPSLRVPLSTLTFLSVNTSMGYRTTYYTRSTDAATGAEVPVSLIRDYTQARTDIVGPVFTKIWDTPDSSYAERMKHVIEPAFTLDYTTPINNYKETPLLTDTSDFVVGGTARFTYGLTNRLMFRGKNTPDGAPGPTREFLTIGVQQTYYSNTLSSLYDTSYASSTPSGKPVDLSPVQLNIRVAPSPKLNATTRLEYSTSGLGLESWTTGATVSEGLSSGSINVSRSHYTLGSPPSSYLSGSTTLKTPNGHYAGTYALSWDLTHATIVTQNVLATYMAQCCGVQIEFQKFNYPSTVGFPIPSDKRINMSFVLAGLGTFSNFFGAFGGLH